MKKEYNGMYITAIVACVAVVALVVLVMNTGGNSAMYEIDYDDSSSDLAGEAKAALPEVIDYGITGSPVTYAGRGYFCYDSDGKGLDQSSPYGDIYNQGTATGVEQSTGKYGTFTESCVGPKVKEYFCVPMPGQTYEIIYQYATCPEGYMCRSGACVPEI